MTFRILSFAAVAAALAGCTPHREGPAAAVPLAAPSAWRAIATRDDRQRLSNWRKAWVKALAKARPRHQAQIAAEGPLLDPDAALPDPAPPTGDYRCRTIKLGARGPPRRRVRLYRLSRLPLPHRRRHRRHVHVREAGRAAAADGPNLPGEQPPHDLPRHAPARRRAGDAALRPRQAARPRRRRRARRRAPLAARLPLSRISSRCST